MASFSLCSVAILFQIGVRFGEQSNNNTYLLSFYQSRHAADDDTSTAVGISNKQDKRGNFRGKITVCIIDYSAGKGISTQSFKTGARVIFLHTLFMVFFFGW